MYYEKGCGYGSGVGCLGLAEMYYEGRGTDKDTWKAAVYFEKACLLNEGSGCFNLGFMHYSSGSSAQDFQKAAAWYERACDLGDYRGCVNLGAMYYDGKGVPQDPEKALGYYDRSCAAGVALGCNNAGGYYALREDFGKAVPRFEQSCSSLNDGGACFILAGFYAEGKLVPPEGRTPGDYYRRACELGVSESCQENPAEADAKTGENRPEK